MNKKILIIEDEEDIRQLLSFRLQKEGYEVIEACDGMEGLERVRTQLPDLVVLDLKLPKLPGEEVCREIRKDQRFTDLPIIMSTAKSQDANRVIGKVIGADHYIAKPFKAEELLALIQQCLTVP